MTNHSHTVTALEPAKSFTLSLGGFQSALTVRIVLPMCMFLLFQPAMNLGVASLTKQDNVFPYNFFPQVFVREMVNVKFLCLCGVTVEALSLIVEQAAVVQSLPILRL